MAKHGDSRNHHDVTEYSRPVQMSVAGGATISMPLSSHTRTVSERYCQRCGWGEVRGVFGMIEWIAEHDDHNTSLDQQMRDEDYEPGSPKWTRLDPATIDGPICYDSTCSACGHKGMEYRPFVNHEQKSYRAFAVCNKCGNEEEF